MKHFITLLLLAISGCGPLAIPAIQRLSRQDQKTVDTAWDNMLSPPDRLDRQTLLDVLTNYQFFQLGIDRLEFQSEKATSLGRVVMTIRFDRADPSVDVFGFDLYDLKGTVVRSERYASSEVFETARALAEVQMSIAATNPSTGPATMPAEKEDARLRRLQLEQRRARIEAATQPVAESPADRLQPLRGIDR